MKILIVYAHPEPTSFNHALKDKAVQILQKGNNEVIVSDLYNQKFNPTANWNDFKMIDPNLPRQYSVIQRDAYLKHQLAEDIQKEQDKLRWGDVVIFQFPLWWFGLPAILKGWFDRIFAAGYAYDKEKWFSTGLLHPRKALLSVTTQSPLSAYQPDGIHGDIKQFFKPIHHTLRFVGLSPLEPFVAYAVMNIDLQERKRYLTNYQLHLDKQILQRRI
jgi:NAD(P)H dehydrogenase (quinone)